MLKKKNQSDNNNKKPQNDMKSDIKTLESHTTLCSKPKPINQFPTTLISNLHA